MDIKTGLLTLTTSALLIPLNTAAADISFPDFSNVGDLTLNNNASQQGSTLQLTPALGNQAGSAFLTTAIALNNESSFSTRFQFQITDSGGSTDVDGIGADGIVFAVQTVANNVGGIGGGIGYDGIANSVGVEFDTWLNDTVNDPNGNHVGVDLNGSVQSVATAQEPTRFNNGEVWTAWVDYDGASDLLEVRYNTTGVRPATAALSHVVDLVGVLGTSDAFVGFTSGTGGAWGDHRIMNWEFNADFEPIGEEPPTNNVPEGGSTLVLLAFASTGLLLRARRRSDR